MINYKFSTKIRMITLVLLCTFHTFAIQQNGNTYLGPNLIVNSDFSSPTIPSGQRYYNSIPSILGWKCTINCELMFYKQFCTLFSYPCTGNYNQAMDLDSNYYY